jgi:hypothetical protein
MEKPAELQIITFQLVEGNRHPEMSATIRMGLMPVRNDVDKRCEENSFTPVSEI